MVIELLLSVVIIAFILGFFDTSLGMGYGTTITPILILLGYPALQVIPVVLFTNAILGVIAGFFHHTFENVNFKFKSEDFKVMLVLTGFGIIGILVAILIAVRLPEIILEAYIGIIVIIVGVVVLVRHKKYHPFSWKKIMGLGSLAAFNKGMSGGGYGSVVVGGQILAGVDGKKAIGIASLAEGLICIVGVLIYVSINGTINLDWSLISSLLIGGVIATPIGVKVVKKLHPEKIKLIIGLVSIILGTAILSKLFL